MHLSKGTSEIDVKRKLVCKVFQGILLCSSYKISYKIHCNPIGDNLCLYCSSKGTQQRKYLQEAIPPPGLNLQPAMFSMLSANKHYICNLFKRWKGKYCTHKVRGDQHCHTPAVEGKLHQPVLHVSPLFLGNSWPRNFKSKYAFF